MMLSTLPNFDGVTLYSPVTTFPPPPGSRGSTGVVIEYAVKSDGLTAWFAVTRKLPVPPAVV